MAASRNKKDDAVNPDDLGQQEVQEKVDAAEEQGFYGTKVDPVPNEEYSLETGPNSPSTIPDSTTRAAQHAAALPEEK